MYQYLCRYNASSESLEVCLGDDHVPAGPLSAKQKRLALSSGQQSKETEHTSEHSNVSSSSPSLLLLLLLLLLVGGVSDVKWLVNRSSSSSIKAFTGTGRTLGGDKEEEKETPSAKVALCV